MKKIIFAFFILAGFFLLAQPKAVNNVLADINRIEASGNIIVYLKSGSVPLINVDLNGNDANKYMQRISGRTLFVEGKGKLTSVKIEICAPSLSFVKLTSASVLICKNQLSISDFNVESDGASSANFDLKCKNLTINSSGASEILLKGMTSNLVLKTSGATILDGGKLVSNDAIVETDGASSILVNVLNNIDIKASGTANVTYISEPKAIVKELSGAASAGLKGN